MTIKVGFTGTQKGMTPAQEFRLRKELEILRRQGARKFHHGDCIGADEQAHKIAKSLGYEIHIHPPTNSIKRAFCKGDVVYPERDYIARNHNIVSLCDMLIATPGTINEQLRSGTWATVRYARKVGKKTVIILKENREGEIIDNL